MSAEISGKIFLHAADVRRNLRENLTLTGTGTSIEELWCIPQKGLLLLLQTGTSTEADSFLGSPSAL